MKKLLYDAGILFVFIGMAFYAMGNDPFHKNSSPACLAPVSSSQPEKPKPPLLAVKLEMVREGVGGIHQFRNTMSALGMSELVSKRGVEILPEIKKLAGTLDIVTEDIKTSLMAFMEQVPRIAKENILQEEKQVLNRLLMVSSGDLVAQTEAKIKLGKQDVGEIQEKLKARLATINETRSSVSYKLNKIFRKNKWKKDIELLAVEEKKIRNVEKCLSLLLSSLERIPDGLRTLIQLIETTQAELKRHYAKPVAPAAANTTVHGSNGAKNGPLKLSARHVAEQRKAPAAAAPVNWATLRILVVDDHDAIREMLSEFLKSKGVLAKNIITAADGVEGLIHFNKDGHEFDLVITDRDMPRMIGDAMVEKIIQTASFNARPIPFVMLTGRNDLDLLEETAKAIYGFISKPVGLDTVLKKVELAIQCFPSAQMSIESAI